MRTVEEQMIEIAKKKNSYQAAKKSRIFAVSGAGLLLTLILVIAVAPGAIGIFEQNTTTSVLGSTILGAETGGYVLTAVVAFTLGIFVAMSCVRFKESRNRKE